MVEYLCGAIGSSQRRDLTSGDTYGATLSETA
jgi:hypothetical protein